MEGSEEDRFIEVATRLFAELGFDGTPLRLIADAAGVDVETLVEQAGDKSRLYRKVMLRAHELERVALTEAAASFAPTRQGVIALVDAYLDFHVAHPQLLALWMHRWIGDAADMPGPEGHVRTLSTLMADTAQAVAAIRGIGETVERTSEIATTIAAAVEEQGTATQEIARSAAQVAEATGIVASRIEGVRAAAQSTGESAGAMRDDSGALAGQAATLREKATGFLQAVRAM